MTKKELVKRMLEKLECALDNDADNQHDMGWDECLDSMDLERGATSNEELDAAYDTAMFMVKDAIETAIKECQK